MTNSQKDPSPEAADQKKRRACDECRTRKLACTKEADGCRRCKRESIACIYSAQKPMGRPRKRPRADEEEQAAAAAAPADSSNALPGGLSGFNLTRGMADGDVGLSILADQVSSPGFTFFDFLGMGDGNALDPTLMQQQQEHQQDQQHHTHADMVQSTGLHTQPALTSFSTATAAIPSLSPPPAARHSPLPTASHRYDNLFPRSLFGINFSDIDFNTGPTDAMAGGVPTPPTQTSNNSNIASPSGGSDVPSLTSHGSQSSQATETPATHQSVPPMVTPGLTPGLAGNSPHGWQPRMPIGILPPSPRIIPQQLPPLPSVARAVSDAYDAEKQGDLPPFEPKPFSVPKGQPTLVGGIPTATAIDAYSKSSAAWLLTAPNRVCGCLARLYLALDSLQHLPSEVGPAMSVARNAAHTAHDTVLCPSCSPPQLDLNTKPPLQAFQNLMILGALLPTIAHTYRRIVAMVDEEAARAAAAKKRLPLSLTAYGGVWGHMAMWDNVCAQTSSIDNSMVEPPLWRLVVRAMLKMDVYGIHLDREDVEDDGVGDSIASVAQAAMAATGNGNCMPTPETDKAGGNGGGGKPPQADSKATGGPKAGFFMVPVHFGLKDIAEMMEERSKMRHKFMDDAYDAGLIKTHEEGGECGYTRLPPGEKPNCQKVIEMARREIDKLVIV